MSAFGPERDIAKCPLSGVKRTCGLALHMSDFDPKRIIKLLNERRSAEKKLTRKLISACPPRIDHLVAILSFATFGRAKSSRDIMAGKEPVIFDQIPDDQRLIEECSTYAQSLAEFDAGVSADPNGNKVENVGRHA